MRRLWLSAASSTSTIINKWIDCFQTENRCCGYTNALDYCCSDQNMEIVPSYINEIEPMEDRIEEVREALQKNSSINLDVVMAEIGLSDLYEARISQDYADAILGYDRNETDNFLYYDELNNTDEIQYYSDIGGEADKQIRKNTDTLARAFVGLEEGFDDVGESIGNAVDNLVHESCTRKAIRQNSEEVKVLHFFLSQQIR